MAAASGERDDDDSRDRVARVDVRAARGGHARARDDAASNEVRAATVTRERGAGTGRARAYPGDDREWARD